jgi:hypothetical protein
LYIQKETCGFQNEREFMSSTTALELLPVTKPIIFFEPETNEKKIVKIIFLEV